MSLTWQEFGANTPRFVSRPGEPGPALLFEPGGTNQVNTRQDGAVVGGSLPIGFFISPNGGLTTTVQSIFVENGLTVVRYRVFGIASAAAWALQTTSNTAINAAPLQSWISSFFFRLVSSPAPANAWAHRTLGRTITGAGVSGNEFVTAFVPTNSFSRFTRLDTLTSDVNLARITQGIRASLTVSSSYDFTFDLAWPDFKRQSFLSNPILAPPGSPAASTIGPDLLSAPLASLGISPNGASTWWFDVNFFDATQSTLLSISDGTASNRLWVDKNTGNSLVVRRSLSGAAVSQTIATATPGVRYGVAMTLDGTGRIRASASTIGANEVVGGPASGLTSVRYGSTEVSTFVLSGSTRRMRFLPFAVDNGTLDSLAAQAASW